jgi:cyclohexanone monooxygenase
MRRKIKEIVHDPAVAEQVTPTEPFFTKRPPLEHGYYAAFNRDNVSVVDMKRSPIQEITPAGVRTGDQLHEVDIIILATGFDAYTGGVLDLNVRGRNGQSLDDKWQDGPVDYLGLMVHGFPNMFMHYCGPYNPAILVNAPILIEQQGEWIAECIRHLRDQRIEHIEPDEQAERGFVELTRQTAAATLIPETDSWWTGTNVDGKERTLLAWVGGFPEYRRLCDEAAADGYAAFKLASA